MHSAALVIYAQPYLTLCSLLQCVLNGHWIVLEDIDFAPPDVVSVLCEYYICVCCWGISVYV